MFLNHKLIETDNSNLFIGSFLYVLLIYSLILNLSTSSHLINLVIATLTTFLLLSFDSSSLFRDRNYFKFLIFTGNISYCTQVF